MWCHLLVFPAMCVLIGVVPPLSVARYVCAGWCDATPCLPAMYVLVGVIPAPCVAR